MTITEALQQVETRLAQIERQNPTGVLKPWELDACEASTEHWGLVQQRLALRSGKPQGRACRDDLKLDPPERTEAQKRATRSARASLEAA